MIKLHKLTKYLFTESTMISLMMIAAIIPMLLVTYFGYNMAKITLRNTIDNMLQTSIQKKVDVINNYISERKINLIQFSELPELNDAIDADTLNSDKMKPLINYLYYITPKIGVSNVYVISMEGKLLFSLYDKNKPLDSELYQSFDGARMLRLPYLSTDFHQKNNFDADIYLSNIIRHKGFAKAVLIMKLNPQAIEKVIEQNLSYAKSEQTSLAMMNDDKPVIVMSTKKQLESKDETSLMTNLFARAIRGEIGAPVELIEAGQPVLAAYHYVPQLNMGMVVQYDKAETFQKVRWLKINIIFMISISLLIVMLVISWLARALWKAHMKSERLLENILPKFVIDELKEKKQFIARNVHDVSIVFMDIVGFTAFTASHEPGAVVAYLDDLFSIIDKLCDKYQLEKIKTIGDAHMSVAGLIFPQPDHAERAVNMALDAILAVQHYNLDHHLNFALRIGIDSGNITAGIIGRRKFSYDVWGTTVNRASRMESTGVANKVQITADTYAVLPNKENYKITPREHVALKGLGEVDTYLVEERIS